MHCLKLRCTSEPLGRRPKIKSKGLKSNIQINLIFRSPCTNFVHRKQLDGLSLAPPRSMRKVRATQSIPLVNVQGVGDGRVDVEENNRLVQTR